MVQQRKKDYLQKIIEDFFLKFGELLQDRKKIYTDEEKELLADGFIFFSANFHVLPSDSAKTLVNKINDTALLEQYAKLLFLKYKYVDIKNISELNTALEVVLYIQATDKTYSWDRTILREDILRFLDNEQE